MVPMGTTKDVARLVDYNRFYEPKIEEFVYGFEYEYVLCSFKNLQTQCIYHRTWKKGIWGSLFGIFKKEHILNQMNKHTIRARKRLSTEYLKKLLERKPLSFKWNSLNVVVFPKETTEGAHRIYINGVAEDVLRGKPYSRLYYKWFTDTDRNEFKFDWRYLIGLDNKPTQTNTLYRYFDGVFVRPESVFKNVTKHFKDGDVRNPKHHDRPENKKQRKEGGKQQEYIKKSMKLKKSQETDKNVGLVKKHNPSFEDQLSEAVQVAKQIAKEKRFNRIIREQLREFDKHLKIVEASIANDINHRRMKQQERVCIQSDLTGKTFKVPRYKAELYTTRWFEEVPKHMWKVQERWERDERKTIAENKLEPATIPRPNPPPKYYKWNDKEEKWEHIEAEFANPRLDVLLLPNFEGETRKDRRFSVHGKEKPSSPQYIKYLTIPPVYKQNPNNLKEIKVSVVPFKTPDPEYEYVPVFKKNMAKPIVDQFKTDEYGNPAIIGYEEEPWMAYDYDENGNKILVHVHKRKVKKGSMNVSLGPISTRMYNTVAMKVVRVVRKEIKYAKRTILQHNFPSKIGKQRSKLKKALEDVKSKKQVEEGVSTDSRDNKRQKQKSQKVEEASRVDKRIKTNIKH